MPEAVIVATARSPIGRANKGSLVDDPPRRPRRPDRHGAARQGARSSTRRPSRTSSSAAASRRASPASTSPASSPSSPGSTTSPASRSTATARRACRRSAWPPTRSRPARATCSSPAASRPSAASAPASPTPPRTRRVPGRRAAHARARRGRAAVVDAARGAARRLHRDGPDRRERASSTRTCRARRWTSSPSARRTAPSPTSENGFFADEITPVTLPDGTVASTRTTAPAPA